jgi:hypothetical protein
MTADPVTEFEQYRNELLARLGVHDPVAVLHSTLDEMEHLLNGASISQLRQKPAADEWSPSEVLNHLADSDLVFSVRARMMVTQDRPMLVGYDQEAWTARFGDLDATPQDTFERWRALRLANLRMIESLQPEEWDRVGVHTERGEESVRLHVRLIAGHDRVHLDQFREGLSAS